MLKEDFRRLFSTIWPTAVRGGKVFLSVGDAEFVEQYTLVDQHYKLLRKQNSGTIAGVAVAGFEIPVAATFNDDAHRAAMRSLHVQ